MSIAPEIPSTPDPDHPEACPHCGAGRAVERRLAMLQQLAEFAMEAAAAARQRIVDQAERERAAPPDRTGVGDQIAKNSQLDFARAAQAVRQTLALQERIEQDHRARVDREAAEASARRAEAAQRRAAERQANIERRRARIQQDLERVIKTKLEPRKAQALTFDLNARLRPERLDSDFGDMPLREIFLRICRNLGIPEEWSRQWDEGSEPDGTAPGDAPTPIRALEPGKPAALDETASAGEAQAAREDRDVAPPPYGTAPSHRCSTPAAPAPAGSFAIPGTGPP